MPSYLLDTNVVSEVAKPHPDDGVVRFLAANDDLWIPSIVVHEIEYGIERLPDGRRKRELRQAMGAFLETYAERIVPIAADEAVSAAKLLASGKVSDLADSLIAGVAETNGLALATRNVRDFKDCGIKVVDPFGK